MHFLMAGHSLYHDRVSPCCLGAASFPTRRLIAFLKQLYSLLCSRGSIVHMQRTPEQYIVGVLAAHLHADAVECFNVY